MLSIKNNHYLDTPLNEIRQDTSSDEPYISATELIDHFMPPVSPEILAENIKVTNKKSPYYSKTKEEIIDIMEDNIKTYTIKGSKIHDLISQYYNDIPIIDPPPLFKQFLRFEKKNKLTPYRDEWTVFDAKTRIVGTVDMAFINQTNNTLVLYDWKITKSYKICQNLLYGNDILKDIPNTKYWKWTIQLNIYKKIIETTYQRKVSEIHALILQEEKKTYIDITLPIIDNIIFYLWRWRRAQVLGTPYVHIPYFATIKKQEVKEKKKKCIIME